MPASHRRRMIDLPANLVRRRTSSLTHSKRNKKLTYHEILMKCNPGYTEIKYKLPCSSNTWLESNTNLKIILATPLRIACTAACQPTPHKVPHNQTDHVESSHRLISTTNLQLIPIGFVVSALLVRTLHCLFVSPFHPLLHSSHFVDMLQAF